MSIRNSAVVGRGVAVAIGLAVVWAPAYAGGAMDRVTRALPASAEGLRLETPLTAEDASEARRIDSALKGAKGPQQVFVQLRGAPVARAAHKGKGASRAMKARLVMEQQAFVERAQRRASSARELGRVQVLLNGVFLELNATDVRRIAKDPAVRRITRVRDYELDLSETVPYIGASSVQGAGFDGSGISVAVLDSGIDYTHANLGGGGTIADYNAAYGDPASRDGLFPTAKVVEGFDFVGEVWPSGPLAPDPDPIDFNGHGTHVADISGGLGGVAPGADLYAVKVCSAVSPSCSGIALLQGMDYAADPNGDGDTSDHIDIVNMSLGSVYGQAFDDDLSQAVENATAIGILTVASAGNSADKPYVTGTPAGAPTALSVAQTHVPSAFAPQFEVLAPPGIAGFYDAVFQTWSAPLAATIEAPLQYGDGAGGNLNGCAPFAAGSLTGLVVLVDRGACFFSDKIRNVGNAGGLVGIIGLVAPGAPFAGGFGGGPPITIPGYMISQADSDALKSGLAEGVIVRFDPSTGTPLIGSLVSSSSRGPTMLSNRIKPEIGAPGASVSADVGTGTGQSPFGGTSGAAPMVAGSAALLLQAYPDRTPLEIKSVLMNTGDTDVFNTLPGGGLAAITRIGGGEVRVDRALAAPAAAWDSDAPTGALSFGFVDAVRNNQVAMRDVTVRNYTGERIKFDIDPTFRYTNDAENGGVRVIAPQVVNVPPHGTAEFQVVMQVAGGDLHDWAMNSGSRGNSGDTLTFNEYDGYLNLSSSAGDIHVPWHVLPRNSGDVRVRRLGSGSYRVTNGGAGATTVESYSLIGSNGNLPEGGAGEQNPTPDFRHIGYATFPVPAGFCGPNESFVMAFAVNTWERQTHANAPALFEFDLDTDQDGVFDYAVFNFDLSLSGARSDGRNVTWVQDLTTGGSTAFFFTDHITNSGNTVLLFCGDQIGMDASNFFDPMDVQALAVDAYFGNGVTDAFTGITISPLGEQYLGAFADGGIGATTIGPRSSDTLNVIDFGPITNNTETGLLLLHRGGAPEDNEASTVIP